MTQLVLQISLIAVATSQVSQQQVNKMPSCGVACLYAACSILHKDASVEQIESAIRALNPTADFSKLSLLDLREVAEKLGIYGKSLRTSPNHVGALPMPIVLYLRRERIADDAAVGHFVLLREVSHGYAEFLDLGMMYRPQRIQLVDLGRIWDGECLLLSNTPIDLSWRKNSVVWIICTIVAFIGFVVVAVRWHRSGLVRMRRLSITTAALVVFIAGCEQEEPLHFSKIEVNCGTVQAGGPVYGHFPFVVNSGVPVEIRSIAKSCECMGADGAIIGKSLEPGSSHELTISLNTDNRAGRIAGTIALDVVPLPKNPIILQLEAIVISGPVLLESTPVYCTGTAKGLHEINLTVESHRSGNSEVAEWLRELSDLKGFYVLKYEVVTQRLEAMGNEREESFRDLMRWTLTPPRDVGLGTHNYEISLALNGKDTKLTIPIVVEVKYPFDISMQRVFVGELQPAEKTVVRIPVMTTNTDQPVIRSLHCDLPYCSATFDKDLSSIQLVINAPRTTGRFEGHLEVLPEELSLPPVVVPISGIVSKQSGT